ncbi:MAG: DUF2309 domain-containing protein [Proteobacteria bacterium]|nr:DUF2309 domain-containing protein [Pseudomonadota bacterium]
MSRALDQTVMDSANEAARAIPPLWPLASSVAVNPFLGQSDLGLAEVAARLERLAGARVTMPRSWYAKKIDDGSISEEDLRHALAATSGAHARMDVAFVKAGAQRLQPSPLVLPTVADHAVELSHIAWPRIIDDRIGAWAASYFDEGQALWAAPKGRNAYAAWRAYATHDLTPEIAGLSGFAAFVADAPESASEAICEAAATLGIPDGSRVLYFHRLLMTLGGWSQLARYRLWQAELEGSTDTSVIDLLAVRLVWEEALLRRYGAPLRSKWKNACALYEAPLVPSSDHKIDAVLQEAAERSGQRTLAELLAGPPPAAEAPTRPAMQVAFCIDVRSEVLRRAIESIDGSISTLGFADFFGLAASYRGFASDVEERHLPVLLRPALSSCSLGTGTRKEATARFAARASRAWTRFKVAAVSSFAFVEAMGPVYFAKLVKDALGLAAHKHESDPAPVIVKGLDDAIARLDAAENILRAMSLTGGFARLIVIAGHGANVTNNPHASALHCGACGGHAGDVNARLLAWLLNDKTVRLGLAGRAITVPDDTLFVAALHDTTTDRVTLFDKDSACNSHADDLAQARRWFELAGKLARAERALRLPHAGTERDVAKRSRDWSEIRPEWGLAGCSAFIAAPRDVTKGKSLQGQAFLHDYDWKKDKGFGVLELILTAPVVVASWISLQYYGSTVAPHVFGGGNKLLHNVVGGLGVVEGNGGVLRGGLPWQSVHDGEKYIHEPLRLSVCIAAPRQAIGEILQRHASVRALFDNKWLHLFALDEVGRMAWRYAGNLAWTPEGDTSAIVPVLEATV